MNTAPTQARCHVRWVVITDLPELCRIEGDNHPLPWNEADFRRALRQRDAVGHVAESVETGQVVGFVIYQLHARHLEILNLAVAPDWRGKTVGTQLVKRCVDKLSSYRRTAILVDVRESNLDAQQFFKALGFRAEAVIPEHFDWEDGYRMAFRIGQEDTP